MEPQSQNLKTAPFLTLGRFHISEDYGFLLPNPLRELPGHYSPWMEIANRLPQLIESHQLRAQVNEALNGAVIPPELVRIFKIVSQPIFRAKCGIRYKVEDRERLPLADRGERSLIRSFCEAMPLLNCQFLTGYREWRLARLVLSFITMGYVWQDGEMQPKQILPRNLALPFVEVSRNLGLPPILVHADLVLANWVTRNPGGPLEIRNLDTIVLFPGGESLRSFILVNVVVEKAAVPGIKALVQAVNAILQPSSDSLLHALQRLRVSIQDITRALGQIHDYVDPDIFYAVIRIFLSGWENNPALPVGLVYEGVSKDPLSYAGGSAAQSTILHSFDEFLGVRHSKKSAEFLRRMRNYMPPSHRAFIEEIRLAPSLRAHVLSSGNSQLLTAYNQCVESLAALRTYHLTLVTKYLIVAASKAKAQRTSHLPRPPQALEKRGTGGTAIMSFLKDVRDKTLEALLHPSG